MIEANEKNQPNNQLLEAVTLWSSNTSAHGFKNIFESKKLAKKVIWIFLLISSIGYCVYQVVMVLTQFFQFNVVTSLRAVYEAPADFPAVVFCNLNAYNGDFAREDMENILNDKNISKENYEPIDFVDKGVDHFKSTFKARSLKGLFDLYYSGFYLNEMLISCRYQGKPCDIDDFEKYHDYQYGNCFRFNGNSSNIRKSKKIGWKNGLRLELFVGEPDRQQQYTYKAGVRIIIHNQSDITLSEENGIDVSVGHQTNIGITRTITKRKPYPYSFCIDNHRSSKNLNKNSYLKLLIEKYPQMTKYNQNFCIQTCIQEFLIKKCNCFDLSLPIPLNITNSDPNGCESLDDLKCIESEESLFYESEINTCYNNCPNECEQIFYETKISNAKYPTKWYTSILKNSTRFRYRILYQLINSYDDNESVTFLDLQQTILMVNVFYDNMNYNLIEEHSEISIETLLAFIGGNLGLFLGISVLSLIEILEIIFYIIFYLTIKNGIFKIKNIWTVKSKTRVEVLSNNLKY